MKLAILNDSHFGVRNSSEIFAEYQARFFKNFFEYCQENGIKQILHLGDLYDHRKYVNFKTVKHVRRCFLEPMRDLGMSMDIIPGNHDLFHGNTSDLCSLKELLGYFVENVNIIMEPRVLDYDGLKIGMIPWINPENLETSLKFIESCDASILGTHLELVGFDVMRGLPAVHGMDPKLFSRFEIVMSGHYHSKSSKDNIHYLGTQYEMTWSDVDDTKFFHVLDTSTRKLEPVENPDVIYSKIYYDDTSADYSEYDVSPLKNTHVKVIVVNKKYPIKFDEFLDRIQKSDTYETKIVENLEEYLGENVDDNSVNVESDTVSLISSYINGTETSLDKDIIKNKIAELYVEASNLEIA